MRLVQRQAEQLRRTTAAAKVPVAKQSPCCLRVRWKNIFSKRVSETRVATLAEKQFWGILRNGSGENGGTANVLCLTSCADINRFVSAIGLCTATQWSGPRQSPRCGASRSEEIYS